MKLDSEMQPSIWCEFCQRSFEINHFDVHDGMHKVGVEFGSYGIMLTRVMLQERIKAWHEQRFPKATHWGVFFKLVEEMGEVAEALNGHFEPDELSATAAPADEEDITDEVADVIIVAIALVARWTNQDVFDAVERKLAKLNDPTSGHRASLKEPPSLAMNITETLE